MQQSSMLLFRIHVFLSTFSQGDSRPHIQLLGLLILIQCWDFLVTGVSGIWFCFYWSIFRHPEVNRLIGISRWPKYNAQKQLVKFT